MLSYRHAFHAGNFADVLKHLVLHKIMQHLVKKDSAFCCIDTHAGAGIYALQENYAQKNREYENGIGKLWRRNDFPEELADFIFWIRHFNHGRNLEVYPGSPVIMQRYLRPGDRLVLFELHPSDFGLLGQTIKASKQIQLIQADGFEQAVKLLPPPERRGLVFLDPAYELKQDYTLAANTLKSMYKRFAGGIYALWLPLIERETAQRFERVIRSSGIRDCHLYELGISPDRRERGMTASIILVINPPWTLTAEMQKILPWLAEALGEGQGHFRYEQLNPE